MDDVSDYRDELASRIMQMIFDDATVDIEGEPTVMIQSIEVAAALSVCLAAVLERAPTSRTPKGMRETAEQLGKSLHRTMKDMRQLREQGHAPFQGETVVLN